MAIPISPKTVLISTSVLFTAVILRLYIPVIMEFAFSETVLSWLRRPYLYVLINCIIIIIVASTKFQNKSAEVSSPETVVQQVPIKVSAYYAVYDGMDVTNASVEVQPEFASGYDDINVVKGSDFDVYETVDGVAQELESKTATLALSDAEDLSGHVDGAVSTPLWSPQLNSTADYSFSSYAKPTVSVRIGNRKAVKSSPEGGKTLGVSRPKRQETLENTWKTITEGRSMPLARHLRKADTWETHGRVGHLQEQVQMMIKSETFNDRTATTANRLPLKLRRKPSGLGKLKREPSPSQDDLNRRVEAFIKKFNEEMRLQRQESLNQYTEMINRGAH